MNWKNKLKLREGDELKFISEFKAGHLGQKERYNYEIINTQGEVVGRIKYVEHTLTTPPFTESYTLQQYDRNENEIISESW